MPLPYCLTIHSLAQFPIRHAAGLKPANCGPKPLEFSGKNKTLAGVYQVLAKEKLFTGKL